MHCTYRCSAGQTACSGAAHSRGRSQRISSCRGARSATGFVGGLAGGLGRELRPPSIHPTRSLCVDDQSINRIQYLSLRLLCRVRAATQSKWCGHKHVHVHIGIDIGALTKFREGYRLTQKRREGGAESARARARARAGQHHHRVWPPQVSMNAAPQVPTSESRPERSQPSDSDSDSDSCTPTHLATLLTRLIPSCAETNPLASHSDTPLRPSIAHAQTTRHVACR